MRALRGLNVIGADLVEVSPPFDTGGITAWLGASVMFEFALRDAALTARRLSPGRDLLDSRHWQV